MHFEKELEASRPALVRQAGQKLFEYGLRDGSEDVVQSAMICAWQRREEFDVATGKSGLRGWLRQIVDYKAADFVRANLRREKWLERPLCQEGMSNPVELLPDFADVEEQALDHLESDAEGKRLYTLIDECTTLSEREKRALLLRLEGDLPHVNVGEIMGVSKDAAKALVFRATSKLRNIKESDLS